MVSFSKTGITRLFGNSSGKIQEPLLLILPLALGILIMLFIGKSGKYSREEGYGELESRVKRLEQRLARIDLMEQRISQFDERRKEDNSLLMERLSKIENSLKGKPNQVSAGASDPVLRQSEKTAAKPEIDQEPDSSERKSPFSHQVREGDTLFKISRLYGVTLDDLRRWNNLAPGEGIRTGQKLRIEEQNSR